MSGASVRCPVSLGNICGLIVTGSTDKEQFAVVADHIMRVHGSGPGEAFEAAGHAFPHVWADYMREAAEHPERFRP